MKSLSLFCPFLSNDLNSGFILFILFIFVINMNKLAIYLRKKNSIKITRT